MLGTVVVDIRRMCGCQLVNVKVTLKSVLEIKQARLFVVHAFYNFVRKRVTKRITRQVLHVVVVVVVMKAVNESSWVITKRVVVVVVMAVIYLIETAWHRCATREASIVTWL
jgi:hypothetical protein